MLRRWVLPTIVLLATLALSACSPSMLSKQNSSNFKEQLYIDARLNFAIKHPLDWQLQAIPVSSPEYRTDTVAWAVKDLMHENSSVGTFLIRSTEADGQKTLPDLLSGFLATRPELKSSQIENVEYPAGKALKLLGHDTDSGRLTIALKGRQRDFIISLDFPTDRFDELLPIFEEMVASFVEIVHPADEK
jgi:hypothetical protein